MKTHGKTLLSCVEKAKKIGRAGATNATSRPDETPYLTRRTALIPLTAIYGILQPVCGGQAI